MGEYLSFTFFWIIIMALIGVALLLVPKLEAHIRRANSKTKENDTQDIADE